jgi:hypothetical protein
MHITIRKGVEHDFDAILSLIKEFAIFQKTPEKVSITLEEMIANGNLFQCFVAEIGDSEIVGFASFFFAYYYGAVKLFTWMIYMLPTHIENRVSAKCYCRK